MRKQYHLQPSKPGLFNAWDVDKLIEATKNFPVIEIDVESIEELDENFWYQSQNVKPTCRSIAAHVKLINQTDLSFPIILSQKGRVMDGMHRVVKALILGHKTIKAVKFEVDPEPDFIDVKEENLIYDEPQEF